MLKIIFNEKSGPPVISANGSVVKILRELSLAVSGIYRTLGQFDPDDAEVFKRAFQEAVSQEEGPVWNDSTPGIMIGYSKPLKED